MADSETIRAIKHIGAIIDRANKLESRMAYLIDLHIGASGVGRDFLRTKVLHSSIVSYGAKIKLISAIDTAIGKGTVDIELLHKIGKIRNSFAHGLLENSLRPQRDSESGVANTDIVIETLRNDLSIRETNRLEAVDTFREGSSILFTQLEELEKKIVEANDA